ncbi:hypothetical protein [Piscirickettsia litoralis]|uniref:Uncharacterized protein n=1 Tax=Piscirickettsia litoralis TaxID=1891921 RepID=A0ABX3A8F9_9GAMM|nr:hypothetical protein [Piscirickettsia litoralis]ODN43850.1 hypothetical protein BGC07_14330 [Piscirickettsia litoralis]
MFNALVAAGAKLEDIEPVGVTGRERLAMKSFHNTLVERAMKSTNVSNPFQYRHDIRVVNRVTPVSALYDDDCML